MNRILIIQNTSHAKRFIRILCNDKPKHLVVDVFNPESCLPSEDESLADNFYSINKSAFVKKLCAIKKIGVLINYYLQGRYLTKLLREKEYNLINIYQIPYNAYQFIKVAHRYNVKVMLTPLGSDVLRINSMCRLFVKRAFATTDFVSANMKTGFANVIKERFKIKDGKMVNLGFGSESITAIRNICGKYSRPEMATKVGIPMSEYYICCGYNASLGQNHRTIIEAIIDNKQYLPKNYRIIIPLSYGPDRERIITSLSNICKQNDIAYSFITDFLSLEQLACLRILTDLFVHIQDTDAYNSSLQEFLLANTEIINGAWLRYPSLEESGIPYHLCNDGEDLRSLIKDILTRVIDKPIISRMVISEIEGNSWDNKILAWREFYSKV